MWSVLCLADLHDSDSSSSSSHQTLRSTARWAASLENLLEDPEGVKRFRVCLFHCSSGLMRGLLKAACMEGGEQGTGQS